jgi:hypothetical protein
LVAATMRASDGTHLALLERAKELGLHVDGQLADLVEKERSAVRLLEEADARGLRIGERAAGVTEELALEERVRDGRAVDGDERAFAALALVVDGARDELLTGSGFAVDEHRRVAVADAIDEIGDLAHGGAAADDQALVRVASGAQHADLLAEAAVLHGARDDDAQRLALDRLGHEVVGAGADGAHGGLERRVARDEHDRNVGAERNHALADLETARLRHAQVGEDDIEVARCDLLESIGSGRAGRDLHALTRERHLEQLTRVALVVDDEDFGLLHRVPLKVYIGKSGTASSMLRASAYRRISPASARSTEAIRPETRLVATPSNNATCATRIDATKTTTPTP